MNGSPTAVLTATVGYVVGAITASGVNDYLSVAVAITGLFVGVSRYGAVSAGRLEAAGRARHRDRLLRRGSS